MAVRTYSKQASVKNYRTMFLEFENFPLDLQKQRELIHEYGVDEPVIFADQYLLDSLDDYIKNTHKWHGFKIEDDESQPIEKLPEHLWRYTGKSTLSNFFAMSLLYFVKVRS